MFGLDVPEYLKPLEGFYRKLEEMGNRIHAEIINCFKSVDTVILSSQVSKYVEEQLECTGEYKCVGRDKYSYQYIEKFYGEMPIFGFILHKDTYTREILTLILGNIPRMDDTELYILGYDRDNEIFQGSYWEWCDFHFFMEDCLKDVPDTQSDLYSIFKSKKDSPEFYDLGISEQLVRDWSSKEGFERRILYIDKYYPNQILIKRIVEGDILRRVEYNTSCLLTEGKKQDNSNVKGF